MQRSESLQRNRLLDTACFAALTLETEENYLCLVLKCPSDQKINSYFSLDFKTMLTSKHQVIQVLSLDLKKKQKKHLFILTGTFLFNALSLLT